ncbi:MAG: EamA family transporter [Roseibium sp.]
MGKFLPFILFTVFTNAAAQILLKYGVTRIGDFNLLPGNPVSKLLQILFSPFVFLGLCAFVISMVSHLYVLSKVDLSYAYPFLSLAYVVVLLYAYFVFQEDLNTARIIGIGLICAGTVFIAQSGSSSSQAQAPSNSQSAAFEENSK